MAFQCPQCRAPDSLDVIKSMQLPPDSRSDEIALQVVECSRCAFRGLAVYEESRRGAFGSESWDYTGYRVGAESVAEIVRAIEACPAPQTTRCRCRSHLSLGAAGLHGRWEGLAGIGLRASFAMRRRERNKK